MNKGSLPITIGITGHRDIRREDIPRLEEAIHSVLDEIALQCPSSPLYFISALAEGADRLAAKIALKKGLKLISPLPMKRHIYEQDFSDDDSRQEFETLLNQSEQWFELPLLAGTNEEDILEYNAARDRQYAYVGAYIARYSHLVIALWDGDPQELVGGTSYVVGFKLRGITPPYVAQQGRFEPEEVGTVYHIVTPRRSHPLPKESPGTIHVLYPEESVERKGETNKYQSILNDTDNFNTDERKLIPELQDEVIKSKSYLSPGLPNKFSDERTDDLTKFFSIADTLAGFYQRKTTKYLRILFSSAMLATMLFEFYAYILLDEPVILSVLFFNLIIAYCLYDFVAKKRFQDKFQDYRALAEGLRIQYYWKLAGIEESVANNYLKEQRSELDWIRHALRSWSLPFYKKGHLLQDLSIENDKERWDIIMNGWIADQYSYFAKSSLREINRLKKMNKAANFFLIGGFSLIAINMIYHYFIGFSQHAVILYFASIFPIAAGLLFGYAEKRSFSAHARQYEKMSVLFAKAKRQLEECLSRDGFAEAQDIIYELGKEALKENGDWVLTHRERPIEVPLA